MNEAAKSPYWCQHGLRHKREKHPTMNREAVYDAWVPEGGIWSLWAKPTLFGRLPAASHEIGWHPTPIEWAWDLFEDTSQVEAATTEQPWRTTQVQWAPPPEAKAMLIVDLPDDESV